MNTLVALVPAVLWGCNPLWAHLFKGKPINQLLGSAYGALVGGLFIFILKRPSITTSDFIWCFISGAGWSLGQLVQFTSFTRLGAATTTPISAGTQLAGVSLTGCYSLVVDMGHWPKSSVLHQF